MNSPDLLDLDPIHEAVVEAGRVIAGYFGMQLELTHKGTSADYRTRADVEAEQVIIEAIDREYPGTNIIAEEHGEVNRGSALTWIIDPLDGTNNFVLGIPAFTTSVALMDDGVAVFGIIHHPITGETYTARRGAGAFRNDEPIAVSAVSDPIHATVSYTCEYQTPKNRRVAFKSALLSLEVRRFVDLWSPAFCYCALASGRMEAILNDGTNLYDFAAGKLIAAEAGARITDFEGNDGQSDSDPVFLASNGTDIHEYLLDRIARPLNARWRGD